MLLEIDQVSVWRSETLILDRLNLLIPAGRHTVVLGPNGSGKTSLLKLLLRQFYPSIMEDGHQGRVTILGQDTWQVDELRKRMGVVSSSLDHRFMDGRTGRMTVRESIASGFTATELSHVGPAMTTEIISAIRETMELLGIEHLEQRSMVTLSTGERRRALIARALVHRPRILVLDEPASGLDVAAQHELLATLQRLMGRTDLTLLLVTHHLEEILPEIHHAVLLDRGRVIFDGPKLEALQSDRLSDLFGIRLRVQEDRDGWYSVHTRPIQPH